MDEVSFVICTCDRPLHLKRCVILLKKQIRREDEIIVVDNGRRDTTRTLCERLGAKWVQERRPGAGWARNTGYRSAAHKIIAFIDDDCQPEEHWCREILAPFCDPAVSVVTCGILGSRPDLAFARLIDRDYSFHRGWVPRAFLGSTGTKWSPFDSWQIGSGGAMAWRKSALDVIEGFDPALGAGTPAGSSEDIDAFRRALVAGLTIYYRPSALVWHDHPTNAQEVKALLYRYAVTLGAHSAKCIFEDGQWRAIGFLLRDWRWQLKWGVGLLWKGLYCHCGPLMPWWSIMLQPVESVMGMLKFYRFRRSLRNPSASSDKFTIATCDDRIDAKEAILSPARCDDAQLTHVGNGSFYTTVDVENVASLGAIGKGGSYLFKKNGAPFFSCEIKPTTSIAMQLRAALPVSLLDELRNL
jgi:glycosyltransferase involved in cell wall biosynthesis